MFNDFDLELLNLDTLENILKNEMEFDEEGNIICYPNQNENIALLHDDDNNQITLTPIDEIQLQKQNNKTPSLKDLLQCNDISLILNTELYIQLLNFDCVLKQYRKSKKKSNLQNTVFDYWQSDIIQNFLKKSVSTEEQPIKIALISTILYSRSQKIIEAMLKITLPEENTNLFYWYISQKEYRTVERVIESRSPVANRVLRDAAPENSDYPNFLLSYLMEPNNLLQAIEKILKNVCRKNIDVLLNFRVKEKDYPNLIIHYLWEHPILKYAIERVLKTGYSTAIKLLLNNKINNYYPSILVQYIAEHPHPLTAIQNILSSRCFCAIEKLFDLQLNSKYPNLILQFMEESTDFAMAVKKLLATDHSIITETLYNNNYLYRFITEAPAQRQKEYALTVINRTFNITQKVNFFSSLLANNIDLFLALKSVETKKIYAKHKKTFQEIIAETEILIKKNNLTYVPVTPTLTSQPTSSIKRKRQQAHYPTEKMRLIKSNTNRQNYSDYRDRFFSAPDQNNRRTTELNHNIQSYQYN